MKTLLIFVLFLLTSQGLVAQPLTDRVTVTVHPGIDLFTVVQLLAGRYPKPNKSAYAKEVEAYFAPFANHPAVQYARQLKGVYPDLTELGYCFDNFPKARIHYPKQTDWYTPDGEDSIQTYMRLCKQFFDDSHFWAFYQQH